MSARVIDLALALVTAITTACIGSLVAATLVNAQLDRLAACRQDPAPMSQRELNHLMGREL